MVSSKRFARRRLGVVAASAFALAPLACGAGDGERFPKDGPHGQTALAVDTASACGTRFIDATRGADTLAGGSNDCRAHAAPCRTIQHGIDVACAGDTVHAARGAYVENVVVTQRVTIEGHGGETILYPAISSPDSCTGDSLCGGTASNVVLVRASGVTVRDLAIDGDNPKLTSGVVRGGADLDARNGIITDHSAGRFDDLVVRDVSVRNVFLRGIYASSGGSFRFEANAVRNVQGDASAVAMFNFGGAGVFVGNRIEEANDAISANHSRGTRFFANEVRASGSGVHTDNAADSTGATGDRIEANDVRACAASGFGIFVFVPHAAVAVKDNRVRGCDVALAAYGESEAAATRFDDNVVRGSGGPGTIGALITTDQLGFGSGNVAASFVGNTIVHFATGVSIVEQGGFVATATLTCNRIVGNGVGVGSASATSKLRDNVIAKNGVGVDATALASGTVDASDNYWGCRAGTPAPGCDTTLGSVDVSGADSRPPRCAFERDDRDRGEHADAEPAATDAALTRNADDARATLPRTVGAPR